MYYCFFVLCVGFLLPEEQIIPVQGAAKNDCNLDTFWYEPWGKSGVYKGIDIFASHGQAVFAQVMVWLFVLVLFAIGGNVSIVLGP